MREEDDQSNWFSKWEDELPSPEDLMPLSQTLITPDLAIAFDIRTPKPNTHNPTITSSLQPLSSQHNSAEFDSPELAADEPARTLKRPRLVWTPQLHKRFVDAVAHLGIKNAVPKTIMQLMSVDGLTRENVASHLQKYRLYLKRMQGLSSGGAGPGSVGDSATDHLFASSPVPPHFLHQGRPNSDHFLPYLPVPALQQMPALAGHHAHLQPRYGQNQIPHFRNGHPLLNGQNHQAVHNNSVPSSYGDDFESASGRKVLTLFPTGDD